jgi:tRNA nucleotidyltransferase (CCA-adding enzyme)
VDGLERISGERIWVELKKILMGKFAGDLMLTILECGLGKYIGLPDDCKAEEFKRLMAQKIEGVDYHPNTMLAAFLNEPDDAMNMHDRLKFSAFERDLGYFITQNRDSTKDWDSLNQFQQMCFQTIGKSKDQKDFVLELLKYHGKFDLYEKLNVWEIPRFPVDGNSLKQAGCPPGRFMGDVINRLKEIWAKNDFKLSHDELLKELPAILEELKVVNSKMSKKPKMR